MNRRDGVLLFALAALSTEAFGDGNLQHQEKADVLFRDLNLYVGGSVNVHGGILREFRQNVDVDPDNPSNSFEIELLGDVGTGRIVENTVLFFEQATAYHGAYDHPSGPLSLSVRQAIVNNIRTMQLRQPPINYVNTAIYPLYIELNDSYTRGNLTLANISAMRSDAVVEFAYTLADAPIVTINGFTIETNPNLFLFYSNPANTIPGGQLPLLPTTQQAFMQPAVEDDPVPTVLDQNGQAIANGGFTNAESITVNVSDQFSGPGRLELWVGAVGTGQQVGENDGFVDGDYYTGSPDFPDGTQRDFTSSDIPNLGNLASETYSVRAIDQSGNHGVGSVVTFTVLRTAPTFDLRDSFGNAVDVPNSVASSR